MIRLMEEHDIPQLARLFLKSRRHTFHWVDPARFQLEDFEEQTKGERVWVAEQGGQYLRLYRHLAARSLRPSPLCVKRLARSGDRARPAGAGPC